MGVEHAAETGVAVHHQLVQDANDGRPPPELSAGAVAAADARSPQWLPSSLQWRPEEHCRAGPGTQSRFLNLR